MKSEKLFYGGLVATVPKLINHPVSMEAGESHPMCHTLAPVLNLSIFFLFLFLIPCRAQQGASSTIATKAESPRFSDAIGDSTARSTDDVVEVPPTLVRTDSGLVQGVVEGGLRIFRGIPYAAPPVGDLRWRPPAPPIKWTGIRDASSFGNMCIQIDNAGALTGSEDCLFLNVFSAASGHVRRQPVMVFLHGGIARHSTHQAPFDAPPLAMHGVIVVTAEYRLGALGFFAHPLLVAEGNSAGNYGLMDQIEALRWVQENAEAFGGDPERIMVFGLSSGGFYVQALLASPLARGLFSRAGIESNAIALGQLGDLASAQAGDAPLVTVLGCDGAGDVLDCLRAVPAEVVVRNQGGIPLGFGPIIEPRVLPADPFAVLQQEGSPVPLLLGSNREETSVAGDDPTVPLDDNGYTATVHAEFDPFGPGVADQVLSLYPVSAYDLPVYALIEVDSDFNITCKVRNVALAAASEHESLVWRYLFTHRLENDSVLNVYRAFHGAESYFVFGNLQNVLGSPYAPTAAEVKLSESLMDYWARFAAYGNPNGPHQVDWPHYDGKRELILELDDTSKPLARYHVPQCDYLSTLPQF
jgi:para-nitrobenzyl esterase